jgi:D-alanine-D-alanine ligase
MKKTIAVVCGGKSGEHEVSLRSAFYVYNNLDKKKYQVIILAIDKKGNWFFGHNFKDLVNTRGLLWKLKPRLEEIVLLKSKNGSQVLSLKKKKIITKINIFFPLIHGTYGEDGCLQGFFELLDVPYVGANVIGSAVGMDKEVTKKILMIDKIPVTKFVIIKREDSLKEKEEKIKTAIKQFDFPLFIKPVSLGSSVGITKVCSKKDVKRAIKEAFQYDHKIIIEKFVKGREIECSVLGNDNPKASLPGEIKSVDFYSYKAKYLDEHEAKLLVPAPLDKKQIAQIQKLSIETFKALGLKGMARIDCFLKSNGQLIVNEVNTIPGFTQISMYPKLWEVSGIKYSKLLDKLVQLAIESHNEKNKLRFSYN